jgi:hypothetical protein
MIRLYHYVRHADIPAFEAAGWRVDCDLGPTHGLWSVLMRWDGEGEPPQLQPHPQEPSC